MKSPLVSIIVPVYNTGDKIRQVTLNILTQSYQQIELIFVNDGSTDNSCAVLEQIKKTDKRISIVSQKNFGPAAARNTGLKYATGELVMFVDSDDNINKRYIEKMLSKLNNESHNLVVCGLEYHRLINDATTEIFTNSAVRKRREETLPAYIIRLVGNDGRLYSVVNKIFYKDIIDQHKLKFNESIDFGEDLLFVMEYLKYIKEIKFILEPLYIYHYGTDTSVANKSSLVYTNWQHNWQYLSKYYQPTNQFEADQLNWVKYRWDYSYCFAVCRSKQKYYQKRKLLSQVVKAKDSAKLGRYSSLGGQKYILERLYRIFYHNTTTLFILINILLKIKKTNSSAGDF